MARTVKVNLLHFGVVGPDGTHHHVDENPHELDEAFARELLDTDRAEPYVEAKGKPKSPVTAQNGDPAVSAVR